MKKIIPLIFSVLYFSNSYSQAVGGWGNCEFATVATMNAFDPSTNAYDCKKVFVQATNEHYHWDGTQWVIDSEGPNIYNTDGTLTEDRTMTMDGHSLTIDGTGTGDFLMEPDGDIGIGTLTPKGQLNAVNTEDEDAFTFESADGTTNEKDVFSIIDSDAAGAGQDHSSVLKVQKNNFIHNDALGFSLLELSFNNTTGISPFNNQDDKYWISGRFDDELSPQWGVQLSDNEIWSSGGMLLNATGAADGTYSGGNFIVEAGGDVGIGTVTPDAKLDVENGTVRFSDYGAGTITGTVTRVLAVDTDGDVIEVTPESLGTIENIYTDNGTLEEDRTVTMDGHDLIFDGSDTDVAIEADGDVGIGTTGPTGQLHAANIDDRDAFLFESADGTSNEKDVFSIIDNDAAGAGQDHSSVLKVQKNNFIHNDALGFSLLELSFNNMTAIPPFNNQDDKYWISGRFDDELSPQWGVQLSDNQIWSSGGMLLNATGAIDGSYSGGNFIVEAGGDVGIGTVTPDARLDVEGGGVRFSDYGTGTYDDASPARFLGVQADGDIIEINPSSISSTNIYTDDGAIDENREVTLGNFDIEFNSTGVGDFYISDNGTVVFAVEGDNVGIGNVSPNYQLQVLEGNNTTASITTNNEGGDATLFLGTPFSGAAGAQKTAIIAEGQSSWSRSKLHFALEGSTGDNSSNANADISDSKMTIEYNGNVGIGTVTPDARLDVEGGGVRFSDYGTGTYDDASPARILGVQADGDIIEIDPSSIGGGGSSSAAIGTIFIDSGDEATTALTEDTPAKASGTTTLINANDVDMPADNRLRYTGTGTQTFFVSCNISVRVRDNSDDNGNNRQIYYTIRKNGAVIPSILSAKHNNNTNGSTELNSTTVTGTVELSTNDYIELWIENIETDNDVEVNYMNMTMFTTVGGSSGGSGSGDNIYTADGTLAGDRTVTMDGNNLTFDGTEDMIIQGDGKVGIGTITPGSQLEVTHDRNSAFTVAEPDNGFNTFLSSISAVNTNTGDWSRALSSFTPNIADGNRTGLLTFGQGDAEGQSGHMYFVDTGAEGEEYIGFAIRSRADGMLNLTGNGDVGIGTTTPDALLDVEGGNVRFSDYGGGAITGTLTRILGVNVDGDVIEVDPSSLGGGGGGGGGSNIYTTSGTLGGNRAVSMDGNDIEFNAGAKGMFTVDGFTGSSNAEPIFQIDRSGGRELKFFHGNDSNTGYWHMETNDGIALELDNTNGKGIYLESTGDVGIGTSTPDAKLDVEGGSVRFSNYGTGTYEEDVDVNYLLGVNATGDVVEMNTAKNSRIFYPPAIPIVADAVATGVELDLHLTYENLFNGTSSTFVKNGDAPATIPTYAQDELDYYILDYDDTVFDNVSINNDGLMTYNIIAPASGDCTFINVVFVVKEQ